MPPTIWGKLIDLDALNQKQDEWRNEVLRRSDTSPLSICGTTSFQGRKTSWSEDLTPCEEFLFSLLNEHWNRIERLSITLDATLSKPWRWTVAFNPAPILRVFELRYNSYAPYDSDPLPLDSCGPIFSNHAPLLHTFEATNTRYHLSAAWLPNIRSLTLGVEFWFPETLDLLRSTPMLEFFRLRWPEGLKVRTRMIEQYDVLTGTILLPHLSEIELTGDFVECVTLLGCIADRGCTFTSFKGDFATVRASDDSPRLIRILLKAAANHYTLHKPTAITVLIHENRFSWSSRTSGSLFELTLRFVPREVMDFLLTEFATLPFDKVNELDLVVPYSLMDRQATFFCFLSSFYSIKSLRIQADSKTIPCLTSLFKAHENLFPLLRLVTIASFDSICLSQEKLRAFICTRRDAGSPISILDLTECEIIEEPAITPDYFDDIDALTIRWREEEVEGFLEHVCRGSGLKILGKNT